MAAMHLPPFHTLGIYAQILFMLYGCTTVALYPPTARRPDLLPTMPTPDNILDHIRRTKSNGVITIPTLLQVWAQDDMSVKLLSELECVVRTRLSYPVRQRANRIHQGYSGGAVSPKLGNFMAENGVKLNPGYGATEFGSMTYPFKRKGDEKDWAYMEFAESCNIRWVPQGDGTYECVFMVSTALVTSVYLLISYIRPPTRIPSPLRTWRASAAMLPQISLSVTLQRITCGRCKRTHYTWLSSNLTAHVVLDESTMSSFTHLERRLFPHLLRKSSTAAASTTSYL